MYAGNPVLHAVNVQAALGQLDLLPLQVADLRGPQTVAIGDQDHGRVAMAVAAMLAGAVHQPVDLALGEVAPLDCQVYDAWCAFLGCRFHADKPCLRVSYCMCYRHLLNSQNPMEKLPARPPEDRPRDRTEGAKAAREGCGYFEGGQVARDRDWHGAAHLKRAWLKALTAILPLSPSFLCVAPRVGGLFGFKFSSRRHPRKFGQKRFLAVRRSWRGNGWPVFGLPPSKNYHGERI